MYGVTRKKDQNDFMFARTLDYRVYGILKDHSVDKPVLIFCPTRKGLVLSQASHIIADAAFTGVVATAEQLMKEYDQAMVAKDKLPWARPTRFPSLYK